MGPAVSFEYRKFAKLVYTVALAVLLGEINTVAAEQARLEQGRLQSTTSICEPFHRCRLEYLDDVGQHIRMEQHSKVIDDKVLPGERLEERHPIKQSLLRLKFPD